MPRMNVPAPVALMIPIALILTGGDVEAAQPVPAWTAEPDVPNSFFGRSIAAAGDVNGDGLADVLVGAFGYSNGQLFEGAAYVYLGTVSGLETVPSWTVESNQTRAFFGVTVASAGDVNGDGYSDILVGATLWDGDLADEGAAFLFLGSPSGPSLTPDWTAEGNLGGSFMGRSLGTAGDVNGDGYSDVVVGASDYSQPLLEAGRALLYLGSASGLSVSPSWIADGPQVSGFFGWSCGTAGDVNADGYDDVIVGSLRYTNGEAQEGAAFVYHGSATGPSATPDWIGEGNVAAAEFGSAVAGAGDVNADGYADVLIGAEAIIGAQQGSAFVFAGSSTGLAAAPLWQASPGGAEDFGVSAAGAGDVNGDGYDDIVVSSPQYSGREAQEGAVFMFLGSPGGPASRPSWIADSDQPGAFLGQGVAAGDIDGDGFSDILAGAPLFDGGEAAEGRAYLFTGPRLGLRSPLRAPRR